VCQAGDESALAGGSAEICPAGQLEMAHPASAVGYNNSSRTGRPDTAWRVRGPYEMVARGHGDLDIGAGFLQATDQIGAL